MNMHQTFSALGDPTRFAIVEHLLERGEQSVGDFVDIADISPPAMSRHLRVLREAGLVSQKIDKQRRLYSVRPEALATINGWTMTYRAFWEASLNRLEALLQEDT